MGAFLGNVWFGLRMFAELRMGCVLPLRARQLNPYEWYRLDGSTGFHAGMYLGQLQ